MTVALSPLPVQKFFDNNGLPAVKGQLFTYLAGSSTKTATFVDSVGVTQNTNPIVLNARGECNLWLDTTKSYKFVFAPATDTDPPTNPIWTIDNIPGGFSGTVNQSQIVYPQTTIEAAASVTPANTSVQSHTACGLFFPERYGTNTTPGTTDMTTAIQNAINVASQAGGGKVWLSQGPYATTASLVRKTSVFIIGEGMTATNINPSSAASPCIVSPAYAFEHNGLSGVGHEAFYGGCRDFTINLASANSMQGISLIGMSRCAHENIRISMAGATFTGHIGFIMDSPLQIGSGGTACFYNRITNCFMEGNGRLSGSMGYSLSNFGLGNFVTATRIEGGHVQGLQTGIRFNKGDGVVWDSIIVEDCTRAYEIGETPTISFGQAFNCAILNPYIEGCTDTIVIATNALNIVVIGGLSAANTNAPVVPLGAGNICIGFGAGSQYLASDVTSGQLIISNPLGSSNPPRIFGSNAALEIGETAGSTNDIRIRNIQTSGASTGGLQGLVDPAGAATELFRFGTLVTLLRAAVLQMNQGLNQIQFGAGSPAGVVVGAVGDLYCRTNGGAATTLYVKESGGGTSAGWVAK